MVRALGRIGDPRAAAPLVDVLLEESRVSPHAAEALRGLGDAALGPLADRFRSTPNPDLFPVARALRAVGRAAPVVGALEGASNQVWQLALQVLTDLPGEYATDALLELLRTPGRQPSLHRCGVIAALGNRRTPRVRETLAGILGEQDRAFGRCAAKALVRHGPAAVPILVEAMGDPRADLRRVVVECLGELEHPGALPVLEGTLADDDPGMRTAAARVLERRAGAASTAALLSALADREPEVRWRVARTLSKRRAAEAAPHLAALLGDPHPRVVWEAAGALADLGEARPLAHAVPSRLTRAPAPS